MAAGPEISAALFSSSHRWFQRQLNSRLSRRERERERESALARTYAARDMLAARCRYYCRPSHCHPHHIIRAAIFSARTAELPRSSIVTKSRAWTFHHLGAFSRPPNLSRLLLARVLHCKWTMGGLYLRPRNFSLINALPSAQRCIYHGFYGPFINCSCLLLFQLSTLYLYISFFLISLWL